MDAAARRRALSVLTLALVVSFAAAARAQAGGPAPRLDMVFAIDATGSMSDEIEQVKNHLWSTVTRIVSGQPRPDLRVGLVVYRDRGDAEHSRVVPLTRDIDLIHRELMGLEATGGGDEPEDVDAALHLVLSAVQWDPQAARLVFLIGDAPPQDYGEHDRSAMLRVAAERQIRIHTIQASGMSARGNRVWGQIAEATGGRLEVLTYAQQVAMADGRSVTTLHRGGSVYRARRVLTAAERAEPVDRLVARGVVEEGDVPAPARAASAPRGAPTHFEDSDVGGIISREACAAAEEMGVAY